jgi:hypothetical protein
VRRSLPPRAGANPRVPRDRDATPGCSLSAALRLAGALCRADGHGRSRRLPRRDPRSALGQLAQPPTAAVQTDRRQLRQRLRDSVPVRRPGTRATGLGRRREPAAVRPRLGQRRHLPPRDPRADQGRLGARHARLESRRHGHPDRFRSSPTNRRRAAQAPAVVPRAGQLVLLPVRAVRPGCDRRAPGGRVPRLDDRVLRLAGPDDNPFALPRLEVHPTLDGAALVQQIEAMRDDPPPGNQYIS